MKKAITILVAACLSVASFAQAKINTMKMKIADFQEKTTKVVLTGNSMHDARLQNAVKNNWTISPVEFCTVAEYESLKSNPDYYFLLTVSGQFEKEAVPGIEFLSLVKGGVGASGNVDDLFEVVTVPFRSIDNHTGREFVLLPALLDIIQDHVSKSMDTDLEGYSGLNNYNLNLAKSKGYRIIFAEEDLAKDVMPSVRQAYVKGGMEIMDADDADEVFLANAEKTLVSFTVAPADTEGGSYCYKMLIDSATHTLYYYRKHKITKKFGNGFLTEDVKRVSASR